ncbi:MAG: 5'/3'-nucleotidase SurE [Pseudomonadota bacterium]
MRILVTNDDGISAPGLAVAEAIAEAIAEEIAGEISRENGGAAEVWVVAPAFEQSGVSHAISFTTPVQFEELGERRFAVRGTPADCVLLALFGFMKEARPDLVISGVNRGHNIAEDAVYSGTVGGAIEAALHGVKAVALSQYYRRGPNGEVPPDEIAYDAARGHGAAVMRRLLEAEWDEDLFFNVNFPAVSAVEAKPLRFAPQGRRREGGFRAEERSSPFGKRYFWIGHKQNNLSAAPEDDARLCAEGWITATPMKPRYTDNAALERLTRS